MTNEELRLENGRLKVAVEELGAEVKELRIRLDEARRAHIAMPPISVYPTPSPITPTWDPGTGVPVPPGYTSVCEAGGGR